MIFRYHLTTNSEYYHQDYLSNKDALNSEQGHWEVYLYGSFEGPKNLDFDPNGENFRGGHTAFEYYLVSGLIKDDKIISTPHNEVIRDICSFYSSDDIYIMAVIALHEIGHWLRLPDGSGAIMDQLFPIPPYFKNCHIKWIRKCSEFPGKWWVQDDNDPIDPCTDMCPNP
jgi:hypothetical protein